MIFLKLGGSLITDKTGVEAVRHDVLARLVAEICQARQARPSLQLLLGHGSGSFGQVAAAEHGTRQGVSGAAQWRGFAEVRAAAARLNRLVVEALLAAGVPALSLPPSASAQCENGVLRALSTRPVAESLVAGLLPVVYGDVAFDSVRGGTIVSTEEVLSFLAGPFNPGWLLLAGETAGVLDEQGQVIPRISHANYEAIAPALGGSRGTDVTGGMASKVQGMLDLVDRHPALSIRIFSGLDPGAVAAVLAGPEEEVGTLLRRET